MNKQIKISQLILESNVPTSLVTKLYNMCYRQESGLEIFTDDSNIIGNIKTGYTYDKFIALINQYFPSLQITPDGLYVSFEDELVESKIVNELMSLIYPSNNYEGVIANITTNNSGGSQQRGFRRIFKNNTEITTFNELSSLYNVKALAYEEFYGCSNLTSIDLTNLESIHGSAFRKCNNLVYFNGPNSEIGTLSLPNLKSNGLSESSAQFFWDNDSSNIRRGPQVIKILDLGDCERIGDNAFYCMNTLEYIDDSVFNKLVYLGSNVFYNCANLVVENLKLPNITTINQTCFSYAQIKKISELGVCTIGPRAFDGCSKLTTITDEAFANITSLGEQAFNNCTNLVVDDLKLPKITSIGTNVFSNTKITNISNLGNCVVVGGFKNVSTLQNVNLPITCNELGDEAFCNCANLNFANINLSNVRFFGWGCLAGIPSLGDIMYFPQCTTFGCRVFNGSGVHSLYLPSLLNTGGTKGTSYPNVYRSSLNLLLGHTNGSAVFIVYLKNINKIHGAIFGGLTEGKTYSLDALCYGTKDVGEYQGEPIFEAPDNAHLDGYSGNDNYWANLKYLVINNMTPPAYYNTFGHWGGGRHGTFSLYMKNSTGTQETFRYLCVPRAAIETYKNWDALNPQFNHELNVERISESERNRLKAFCEFDVNTRIIAIESMGHFATKAEYDASTIVNKQEYLIEEYMDLDTPIQWDPTPTWSA